jgi:hypothetical protein
MKEEKTSIGGKSIGRGRKGRRFWAAIRVARIIGLKEFSGKRVDVVRSQGQTEGFVEWMRRLDDEDWEELTTPSS